MAEAFTNFAKSTLSAAITNVALSLTVVDGSKFPTADFYVVIDGNDADREIVHVNSRSGNTLTLSARGQDGTTGVAHDIGSTVIHGVLARHLDVLKQLVGYVNHGATATVARPDVDGIIMWIGSVEPTNKIAGDIWWYSSGLSNMIFAGYGEAVNTNNAATGTVTLNVGTQNVHNLTLTGNTTIALTAPPNATDSWSITIIAKQDATGGRTITWPSSMKWPGGSAPVMTSAANSVDVYTAVTVNGGTTWYAVVSGQAFA